MDDEFIASSLDAKWTGVNASSGNLSFSYGRMAIVTSSGLGALTQPKPTAPCEFLLKMTTQNGNEAGNPWIGFGFSDGTKYQVMVYGFINGAYKFEVENLSAYNTYSSSPATQGTAGYRSGEWFIRIKDDGTNLIYQYSLTGDGWKTVATISRTAYMGSGPNKIAIHWTTGETCSIDYVRRTL